MFAYEGITHEGITLSCLHESSTAPSRSRESSTARVWLAQLDRASGYGPEGRGFESSTARKPFRITILEGFFIAISLVAWYSGLVEISIYLIL